MSGRVVEYLTSTSAEAEAAMWRVAHTAFPSPLDRMAAAVRAQEIAAARAIRDFQRAFEPLRRRLERLGGGM